MKKIIMPVAMIGLIAGCSDSGADADGDGTITQEEVVAEMKDGGAINMKAGKWEVTNQFTTFEAPGVPEDMMGMIKQQMGKGTTISTCLTEEDVANPGADFFGNDEDDGCEFTEFNRSGNSMKIAVACDPGQGMKVESAMDGSYSSESYEMDIDAKMSGSPMGDISMKGKVTGKYVGACDS